MTTKKTNHTRVTLWILFIICAVSNTTIQLLGIGAVYQIILGTFILILMFLLGRSYWLGRKSLH